MLLARLGVDKSAQAAGRGRALLKDALLRIAQAALETSPTDPFHLFLLIKDLKAVA